jgi:predicted DNA-binding antitoxin AbrB/MazE fold protein
MLAVNGYYDGVEIKPLEKMDIKQGQKVIITILNDFVKPEQISKKRGMRGALAKYADPELQKKEKGAWERAAVAKYDNA